MGFTNALSKQLYDNQLRNDFNTILQVWDLITVVIMLLFFQDTEQEPIGMAGRDNIHAIGLKHFLLHLNNATDPECSSHVEYVRKILLTVAETHLNAVTSCTTTFEPVISLRIGQNGAF